MKQASVNRLMGGSALALAMLMAVGARAAEADAASGGANAGGNSNASAEEAVSIGDIVVTAQKRSERLADVPMSITAMTGDQMLKSGITDPTQLSQIVPGFSYQPGAFGAPILSIRGIGFNDNSVSAGPAVTAYVDQVALPYSVMARGAMLDLERVEVLKGPQGTLFGMNSTGGAINFIAAKPTPDMAAGLDLKYGRFNEVTASGFISGPLGDTLRARLALQYERADGWQRSATRSGDKLGDKEFVNGRLLLDWTPSDRLSFELSVSMWHDGSESQAAQFVQFSPAVAVTPITQYIADAMSAAPTVGDSAREADWDANGDYDRDDNFYQGALRADWRMTDTITLTSITAYSEFHGQSPIDVDGTAFTAFNVSSHKSYLRSFAQELRLDGDVGPLRWMVGANYQDDIADESTLNQNQATNNQIGPFLFTQTGQIANQDIETKSAFGSLDYHVTDALTLQASARYTKQNRDFIGCIHDAPVGPAGVTAAEAFSWLASFLSGRAITVPAGGCLTMDDATFNPQFATSSLNEDNVSWRLGADYRLSPRAMVYANVTKGYKSGSYSLVPGILASQFTPVTQESVLAVETGTRLSTPGNVLEADLAVFYADYRDKQLKGIVLNQVFGPLPQLVNIPKSEIYGFEFNLVARPTEGLRLTGGLTYVKSKVLKDPVAPAEPRDPYGVLTSYIGEAFPNTPKWQFIGDAEYRFPVGSAGMEAYVGASLSYRSKSTAAFAADDTFELPDYALLDLRAGVESGDGRWSGQIWGRNVTNKYYWNNVTHLTDYVSKLAGMPATYGISLSVRY